MVEGDKMVRTVTGKIDAKELGNTYIHEHLYVIPNDLPKYEDYTFDDIEKSIIEVLDFKKHGGNSIVDLTPINYGRNPIMLENISKRTGINVLFVTGFHKEEFMPKWIDDLSSKQLYEFLFNEINNGVSSHHLLPAAIKIGTSYNEITPREHKVIEVVGNIQKDTQIPIITHCDKGTMGIEQVNLLCENGANVNKICLSHVDLKEDVDYLEKICELGANISFDHVGRHLDDQDSKAVSIIRTLINDGFSNQICLAGDMGRKKYFKSYDGKPGLSYILSDFKERLLMDISIEDFDKMVQKNPIRILDWDI